MTLIQPRTAPGTLELLPREQIAFQNMLDAIRRGYESFGFLPVETPVFELKDVLLTKSGGETEKQVYFVQSTGSLQQKREPELALRFDLTVPLARYVAEHERDLAFPFRRYQMQRVYRGERPQKGREREFYQCDIDVIGKDKLDSAFDAELPAIITRIFEELDFGDFTINFSNRKILLGLLASRGIDDEEKQKLVLREIDKLDKIGRDKVRCSLVELGLNNKTADEILSLIEINGGKDAVISELRKVKADNEIFRQGLEELSGMVRSLKALGVPENRTKLNLAIARGLDYYTGTVYETFVDAHPEFGSVCSGGRYENLAGHYTKSRLPGVGLSIGATRLFDQLTAHNLIKMPPGNTHVLVSQMDAEKMGDYLAIGAELRRAGFNVENYLEPAKLEKQLKYADKNGIPVVVIMGGDEAAKGTATAKDMRNKTQREINRSELAAGISAMLSQK